MSPDPLLHIIARPVQLRTTVVMPAPTHRCVVQCAPRTPYHNPPLHGGSQPTDPPLLRVARALVARGLAEAVPVELAERARRVLSSCSGENSVCAMSSLPTSQNANGSSFTGVRGSNPYAPCHLYRPRGTPRSRRRARTRARRAPGRRRSSSLLSVPSGCSFGVLLLSAPSSECSF